MESYASEWEWAMKHAQKARKAAAWLLAGVLILPFVLGFGGFVLGSLVDDHEYVNDQIITDTMVFTAAGVLLGFIASLFALIAAIVKWREARRLKRGGLPNGRHTTHITGSGQAATTFERCAVAVRPLLPVLTPTPSPEGVSPLFLTPQTNPVNTSRAE